RSEGQSRSRPRLGGRQRALTVRRRPPQNRALPLVGRERELALMRDTLVRVREERSSQLVTLVGVPGIGKSRLVYELMQFVQDGGVLTYWRQGRSLPYGESVSYWALSEIVKAQAGVLETDSAKEVQRKLQAAVVELVGDAATQQRLLAHAG